MPIQFKIHNAKIHVGMVGMFKIYSDDSMVEVSGIKIVKRTIFERLFSKPWKPFTATKEVVEYSPRKDILRYGDKLIMHPSIIHTLREQLK